MKKIVLMMSILSFMFLIFDSKILAKESTLNELEAQAKSNREAYNKAKSQKALTEQERDAAVSQKAQVESDIKDINNQIDSVKKDVDKLQKSIDVKNKEIKEIMKFVQVSNGESAYLEYAFGASSFTDFIYRVSVAEQLSSYNEDLIKDYNKSVKELEQKQKDLAIKQNELTQKQQELSVLEAKLNKEIEEIGEGMLSKDEEYKTTIGLINNLKSLGCSGSDTMSSCQRRMASNYKNRGGNANYNGTYMPLASGYVSSDYGQRSGEFHTGIDFSNHAVSTVYPVTGGQVVYVRYGSTSVCGNHIVYVYHPDYGYTTSYWHLTSSYVKKGDYVSASTPLGKTGGPDYTDGDSVNGVCAYGGHVHLNLFNGLTTTNSGRINPRNWLKNIPGKGVRFTSPR